jgi:hypothetical protein
VGLLLFLGALAFIAYLLGEQAGRESPARSKQLQEIVSKEAELKNLKSNLNATTTAPWLHILCILLLVLLFLFFWRDGGGDYQIYRHRH